MTQIHEQIPCENIYYIRLKRKLTSLSSINTALDQLASQYEQELLPPPQSGGSALWAKFPYHPSPRALHSRLFPFSRAAFLPRSGPQPFLLSPQALLPPGLSLLASALGVVVPGAECWLLIVGVGMFYFSRSFDVYSNIIAVFHYIYYLRFLHV